MTPGQKDDPPRWKGLGASFHIHPGEVIRCSLDGIQPTLDLTLLLACTLSKLREPSFKSIRFDKTTPDTL